jgi:hypothetical protein
MPKTRRGPAVSSRATSKTTATVDLKLNPNTDELLEELRRIKAENGDLFTALLNGTYRLAVPCARCGKPLISSTSRRAGLGSRCAAILAEAVAR